MTLLDAACPKCGFPKLLDCEGVYEYHYAAQRIRIEGIEYARCHRCGSETFLPEQIRRNNQRIADANMEALAARWAATVPVVLSSGHIEDLLKGPSR